ncbi:MAG: glycosyltransferase [Bacteroidota bacterium]
MKILIVNTSDTGGGASKAAVRLFEALLTDGIDVSMLVHEKNTTNDRFVSSVPKPIQILQSRLDKYECKLRGIKRQSLFSIARFGNDITKHEAFKQADVVNIHWVNRGFLSVENLGAIFKSGKKIVWTLHDSWAFTGGCHLPYDCILYKSHCGTCPAIASDKEHDLAYSIFERKQQSWKDADMSVFAPSNWSANKSLSSVLLKNFATKVFPNALNTDLFKVYQQEEARVELKLPLNKKIILFGAMNATSDVNKGYSLLLEAIRFLIKGDETFSQTHALCIVGSDATIPLPMDVYVMGTIYDDHRMAKLYAASDVFVLPSKSENLPYTIMESLACGTPAVAFNVGGISELVKHQDNGYLAQCYDTSDLANGILHALSELIYSKEIISKTIKDRYGYKTVSKQFLNYIE